MRYVTILALLVVAVGCQSVKPAKQPVLSEQEVRRDLAVMRTQEHWPKSKMVVLTSAVKTGVLTNGMPLADVNALLGPPQQIKGGYVTWQHKSVDEASGARLKGRLRDGKVYWSKR